MFRWAVLLLALAACALANVITIKGHDKACFFEDLQQGDKITVTYEVGGSEGGPSDLDVDFHVGLDNEQKVFYRNDAQPQGTFSTSAMTNGRYIYCFRNTDSSSTKTLSFNLHGVRAAEEDEQMAPVEREIRNLASGLQLVSDEGSYLVIRERVHRNTCESTNARVKWWAIFQIFLLLALCAWNVRFIKSWFEVKRVL